MGRPREHDDTTREALLQAAERLVHEYGSAAVSVRGVADAAGTSTRAVYSLFGSKAGLLEALATQLFRMLGTAIDAAPRSDDPVADVVAASIDGFRRTALEHPALFHLVFGQLAPGLELGPDHTREANAAFARLETLLERVTPSGGSGHRIPDAARAVHALTEGLATVELRGELGDPDRALDLWHTAVTALVRGLTAPDPPRSGAGRRPKTRRPKTRQVGPAAPR